jgi:hypothetical protein
MRTGQVGHRPLIEVLHVQDCPNYPGTLALVQRVLAELGIDAEVRTTLITDQLRPRRRGLRAPRPFGSTGGTSSRAASHPQRSRSRVVCIGLSTGWLVSRPKAGFVRRCWGRSGGREWADR